MNNMEINGNLNLPLKPSLQQKDDLWWDLELPEIGKTYNCFDDGKISESRRYEVSITEIIPFNEADEELLNIWEEEGKPCYWMFDETDFFIKFKSTENEEEPNGVFARTKDGGWFGLGNWWNSGRLDIDGSLTESLSTLPLTFCK